MIEMTPDERTVLSALELLDTGTEQPIRVWAFKRILDSIECLRNEIRLRDEAITRLEAEFDATCNAEELRQVREDNKRLQAEVARLEKLNASILYNIGELERIHKETVQQFRERVSEQLSRIAELEGGLKRFRECGNLELCGECMDTLAALLGEKP